MERLRWEKRGDEDLGNWERDEMRGEMEKEEEEARKRGRVTRKDEVDFNFGRWRMEEA